MAGYRILPEQSRVWIEAQSSVHPVHGGGAGLEGELELDFADGQLVTEPTPVMRIRLPVSRLESGNRLNDLAMRQVIAADRFPVVSGEARRVTPTGEPDRYRVAGELTFHGVTRAAEDEIRLVADADGVLIEGEHVFDVREFGVKPPRILMLRVHPDVAVRIAVRAVPADQTG